MLKYELVTKILSGFKRVPRVAILMSGKWSNAKNILENRFLYPNIDFRVIVSDTPKSNAKEIAFLFGLKNILIEGEVSTKELRSRFFERMAFQLLKEGVEFVIYAGFMKIATKEFVSQFPGINMHPSDLTLLDDHNVPLFRGMSAIEDALRDGQTHVASTLYVVDDSVDAWASPSRIVSCGG